MAMDFPNSPAVGQQYTVSGTTWTWDGTKWLKATTTVAGPQGPQGPAGEAAFSSFLLGGM